MQDNENVTHNEHQEDELVRNENTQTSKHYAGFWMRFWAYITDIIIVFSINGIILSPLKFLNDGKGINIGYWTLIGLSSMFVLYLYFVILTKWIGQTIGKMIFGLKVVREDDKPVTLLDVFFREVIGRFGLRVFPVTLLLYLFVAFMPEKQGIHDMLGNTRVIHEA